MTKIKLCGELGKKFGQNHNLALNRLTEFGQAMESNYPGFKNFFVNSILENKNYSMFVDGVLMEDQAAIAPYIDKAPKEIVIVPFITGAYVVIPAIAAWAGSAAAGAAVAAGASLATASLVATAVSSIVSMVLMAVVTAVVSALFAPKPKGQLQTVTANAGLNSYYFAGRANSAQQGQPVPVVYGELKVGSYVIQAGIRNLDKDDFAKLSDGSNPGGSGTYVSGTFVS